MRGHRDIFIPRREEGRADAEDGRDERGIVERDAIDDGSAPIMTSEDNRRGADDLGERSHVVRGRFVRVGAEVLGRGGASIALHVQGDDAEVEGLEGGDLVTPAKGHVWPLERRGLVNSCAVRML